MKPALSRLFSIAVLALINLVPAADALAVRLGGSTVVVPIIGRFAGANGTQWRTDVFLTNAYGDSMAVTLSYYPTGGALMTRTLSVGPYNSAVLPDIVLNTFGLTSSAGVLEVSTPFVVMARARIYNAGNPAGQFGQSVPGLGTNVLQRQALIHGLSGINGNRLNVGVTNPNDVSVDVGIGVRGRSGETLLNTTITVPAHGNVQYNDVFAVFGIAPQEGVTIQFNAFDKIIYGYASEVRNDTGDAVFVFGEGPNA